MLESGALLLIIGCADLARGLTDRLALSRLLGWSSAALVTVAASFLFGIPLGVSVILLGLSVAWIMAMPSKPEGGTRIWPAVALALIIAVSSALLDSPSRPVAGLLDLYAATPLGDAGVSLLSATIGVGCLVFLTRSSNLITRAAITSRAATTDADDAPGEKRHGSSPGTTPFLARIFPRREDPSPGREANRQEPGDQATLVGGRVIGPIERLMIVAMVLSGAVTVLAALIAAKGVVRFPEISADRQSGTNAETFLVGSLASWSLAGGASLLIWLSVTVS